MRCPALPLLYVYDDERCCLLPEQLRANVRSALLLQRCHVIVSLLPLHGAPLALRALHCPPIVITQPCSTSLSLSLFTSGQQAHTAGAGAGALLAGGENERAKHEARHAREAASSRVSGARSALKAKPQQCKGSMQ